MLRIRELRLERDLTQKELAEKISSTSKNIWAYENNIAIPPLDVLIKLADFFQCSIDYLTCREDELGNITIHTEKPAPLPQDEQELLNIYQALSPAHRSQILEYARYFAEKSGVASTRRKA